MSGSVLLESPIAATMMNLSLTSTSRGTTQGGFLSGTAIVATPPLRRNKHASAAFRDTRSPSPAPAYPASILRQKNNQQRNNTHEHSCTAAVKSSLNNVCSHNHLKITTNQTSSSSSQQVLSSQLRQISLSTGTESLEVTTSSSSQSNNLPTQLCPDILAQRILKKKDGDKFYLLDCRSFISYNLCKISGALNVCCTDRCSQRRLLKGRSRVLDMVKGTDEEKDAFRNNLQAADIILYDDSTKLLKETKNTNNALQLIGSVLMSQGATNVTYLKGKTIFSILQIIILTMISFIC